MGELVLLKLQLESKVKTNGENKEARSVHHDIELHQKFEKRTQTRKLKRFLTKSK